jgi:perosamine synthetase
MMDSKERKEILNTRKLSIEWQGEPHFGSSYGQEEIDAVVDCIKASMAYNEGFGFVTKEIQDFEDAFAKYIGTNYALSINGAGGGLDMAMKVLNLEPEDEVIVSALNFPGDGLAPLGERAKLILCECDERTFQADPEDVERRITKNTRAIMPVHMNGLSAPMDELLEVASRHKHHKHGEIKVIGDAARATGADYKDSKCGKKGWLNIYSFHTMKNMTTLGEGGMITTDDEEAYKQLRGIRQFGWETGGWGSNYKMTRVQAAVGLIQLGKLDQMIALRRRLAKERNNMLEGIPHLTLPYEPEYGGHSYYLYTLLVPEEWAGEKRDRLIEVLRQDYGVDSVVANPSLCEVSGLLQEATKGQEVPRSVKLGRRIFCVPIHPKMPDEDNEYICAALWESVDKVARE